VGISKKSEADSSHQDEKKEAEIGFAFHEKHFLQWDEVKKIFVTRRLKFT
jgi:hypothetical protein